MDFVIVSFSFVKGGAAIAAARFLSVARKLDLSVSNVRAISQDGEIRYVHFAKRVLSYILGRLQFDRNPVKHSLNLFTCPQVAHELKVRDNFFHFHWVNNDTLGLADLKYIPSGSIVTLHDEWFYCGSEHCFNSEYPESDFIDGYPFFSKRYLGFNFGFLVWKVKLKALKGRQDIIFTVPSRWILERARLSAILRSSDVRLLPNPIDVDQFSRASADKVENFRRSLSIDKEDFVIAFGAVGGKSSVIKGGYVLDAALQAVSRSLKEQGRRLPTVITFGGRAEGAKIVFGLNTISLGHISNAERLALLYSSVDCVVVPSLVESFGQVAAEALACETPVVCFNRSGLTDIVLDGITGLTAKAYNAESLAKKIIELIDMDKADRSLLGEQGRRHVVLEFSYPVISALYKSIIEDAIKLRVSN